MLNYICTNLMELIAAVTGLIGIYLAARNHIWNWLFGIIAVILYFIIFFQVKLYAAMGLQVIYFALQFYGLYQWRYGSANHTPLTITKTPSYVYLVGTMAAILLFGGNTFILSNYTDSNTIYIDAFTASISLIAQWMMSKKWLEHWLLWMVADLISINMYLNKKLFFTSSLYAMLFMLCIFGYFGWRKQVTNNSVHVKKFQKLSEKLL